MLTSIFPDVIDSRRVLASQPVKPYRSRPGDLVHFSRKGHEVVAESLLNRILEKKYLPGL